MKVVVKKSETTKIQEHSVSTFTEYTLPFTNLSVGVSEIHGLYPQTGFDVDTEIEQVWYVESGEGKIWLQGSIYEIASGDMILIPKGKKYWIEGDHLKLIVSSAPPWFPQQHKHIP